MLDRLSLFLTAAATAMTLALPAAAQDAETEAPQTETEAPQTETEAPEAEATDTDAPATDAEAPETGEATETGNALPDLDLGNPVEGGEPAEGQPYIRETFDAWSLRCINAPEGQPDPCELYQLLTDQEGNEVAEISVVPLPEGGQAAAGATVVAPLETLLTEQLVVSVDGGAARQYPFRFCNRAGCVAQIGLTTEQVNQFKRGANAQIRLVPAAAPDQEVRLDASLSGFTAGFEAANDQ
ncbi:invasion associated locus B family protein [Histidinibacterium aquaticum]|uniref:Invasion associated locus B family protein n=1 Tax=Histidinibacterium aquaticum TaxID=2613962 RepID=A0A5J5GKB3_9RHOB|nr:invasion associated locus B family protein [Histidinibacterium aquaticum]KAA9008709.1 invasion associated locus B family protein [Histidinibacterium aquaticum]